MRMLRIKRPINLKEAIDMLSPTFIGYDYTHLESSAVTVWYKIHIPNPIYRILRQILINRRDE